VCGRLACGTLCDRSERRMRDFAQPFDEEMPALIAGDVVRQADDCQRWRVDD